MKNIKACLTNKSDLWKTPNKIYKIFMENNYYDPCPVNPQINGLETEWKSKNYVNPPYSEITKWIDKAIEEQKKGKYTIMLIPSRTDTKWFRKLIENNCRILFIQGRLKFNDSNPAPFPSMIVEFANYKKTTYQLITKEQLTTLLS